MTDDLSTGRYGTVCTSVLDAVGRTPLVDLSRIAADLDGRILAKLEYLNPGYSKKDRIALQMVEDAEASGLLAPGQTVVELTSGKGHPFVAVMSKGNSIERARMMRALGAEVVLVDQAPGSPPNQVSGEDLALVEEETRRIVKERGAVRTDQFEMEGNPSAHYLHTGPEIFEQAGRVDAFCDFVGSGGSFAGCARYFKERDPSILCFVLEPDGAAVLAGERVADPNHRIQGGGYSRPELKFINRDHIDGFLKITDEEAIAAARRLAREEGIFAGFSSGANVAGAVKLLRGPCSGKTIVVLLNDSGLKYLSTELWE